MLFLNPTILLGLLAASIPLLIHLLNLRKLKKIDFSTLKFLKELQKSKIRRIKFKQWLLLALRILIILFIVLAFARPTIKNTKFFGTSSASKTSMVFILDDSFSMSLVKPKGSLFNQAKAQIKKILSLLKEGDDAEIILLSNALTKNFKLTKNINQLKNKIAYANISSISGNLNAAITKGLNLLSDSKNLNKELYILSDFQKRNITNDIAKNVDNFENIRLFEIFYDPGRFQNIGIDKLVLGSQIIEKNKPIKFYTTLTNYSSEKINNIVLSLFINGERKNQKNISLNSGTSINVGMNGLVSSSGFISAFVEIDDDDLFSDNRKYISFYIPEKIHLALIADKERDKQFVLPALTSSKNKDVININELSPSQLASVNLTAFDVIIFIPSKNSNNLNRLNKYIREGGNLIVFPGSDIDAISFQKVLSELNFSANVYSSGIKNTNENFLSFDKVDFEHPVFENLFDKQDKKEIDSPNILYHLIIKMNNVYRTIIRLNDNSSFLMQLKRENGKVLLFNTAPVLGWSNFPIKGIFAPLLNKAIFYLSSKDVKQDSHIAGNEISLKINNPKSKLVEIIRPNKTKDNITLDQAINNSYINYKSTNQIGIYKILNDKKVLSMFSINANLNESQQEYLTKKEIENYLQKINFKGINNYMQKDENVLREIKQTRFGSELWKYCVIIALLLALIEMLVARNTKNELMGLNNI